MRLRATIAAIILGTALPACADDSGVSGFTGLRGSLAFQDSIRGNAVSTATPPVSGAVKINGKVGGGGSIYWGMHLPYGFRTELELLYRYVPLSNGEVSLSDGTSASGAVGGYGHVLAPMLNAYWDIPLGDIGVQPFLGGGVGYAWNELGVNQIGTTTFASTIHNDSWNFSYDLMAGLSTPLSEGSRLTAMYRWLHEDINVPCSGTITCSGAMNSHSVDLGLEFDL